MKWAQKMTKSPAAGKKDKSQEHSCILNKKRVKNIQCEN